MLRITGSSVFLRTQIKLPVLLKLATEQFQEGWDFIPSARASGLEKKIRSYGWYSIRIAEGSLRSGVGETPQQAIACALKLAVRGISEYFNALEIRRIQLTEYPWFFLARVLVHPLRIQQSAIQAVPDDALPLPSFARKRQSRLSTPWTSLRYGCAVPLLKEMLSSSASAREGAQ